MLKTGITIYRTLREIVTKVYHILKLQKYETPKGRKEIIENIDAVTLSLFKQAQGIATKKSLFEIIEPGCSYKTFVISINRCLELLKKIIGFLVARNRFHCHAVKHTDATDLPVSTVRKAKNHKTMKELASWSKSSKGWFYGLKLHLTTDLEGKILALRFSSANGNDRDICKKMNKDLDGIFVVDAGYISSELERDFFIEHKRMILTIPRKNMKKLATALDIELLNTRMRIEDHFGNLKQFHNLTSTVCRSVTGFLVNYLSAIAAYMIA
jgi:Transposase DDE domain.